MDSLEGVLLTELKIISHPKGNILHAIKCSSQGYYGFGEAYFSTVKKGEIKGWKKHNKMVLNLIVPIGAIKFVLFDDRVESGSLGKFFEIQLSNNNYYRLTVPTGVWMAFEGVGEHLNLLLNVANIEHSPDEAETRLIESIAYNWI